ncbi:glycosyltransferase family 2 protein [Aliarcobacter skirrowii]|uniref:glycosyltransferase family 2 protein n=1 Tax=Aliarcobacter skirrowii TaxID=28200 RepID=UPI0029A74922|nr:glycosyltransferase family 2 protein [Aliarcobacter skirrowii]MDX4027737.1 glycosyltransferase family 2 protein [Aliarcobacter skirrowii]
MEINKKLSIVIPTYNRADFLDYSLEIHIPMLKEYGIEIAIFDNASTDNTQEVVSKWMKEYKFINYIRHEKNFGAVKNFEYALSYPNSEYIWLLGDTYKFNIEMLINLLNSIESRYDLIIFNLSNKVKLDEVISEDYNLLLNKLGALITCASVTIINKNIFDKNSLDRYLNTNFPHTGLILESISNKKNIKINFLQEYSIESLSNPKLKKTNWSHTPKAFEIGCEDWTNFVMSLPPSYKLENKMKCIMDFGKVSGLFTFKNLVLLRTRGLIDIKVYNRYKKLFPFTVDYPLFIIFIISITPKFLFKILLKLYILTLKKNQIDNFKFLWKN